MAKEDCVDFEGTVIEAIPGAQFKVQVELPNKQDSNEDENSEPKYHYILATLAGKLRVNGIKILVGDRVRVETSFYDLTRGRITWRFKGGKDQPSNAAAINTQASNISINDVQWNNKQINNEQANNEQVNDEYTGNEQINDINLNNQINNQKNL